MMTAQELHSQANENRANVIKMVVSAGAGHIAGPLSSADIFTLLYMGGVTRFDPHNQWWEERDRIVLSAGHYCPILYAVLAQAGYFPRSLLSRFGQFGSDLGLHPEHRVGSMILPGIENSSGSLGQGVSVAVGMALALKLTYGSSTHSDTPRVYCILSDGEMEEGQVWEAFTFAVRRQLDNLIFIVDRNRIQIERYVSEVATYGHVAGRLESFGLNVLETDGHDFDSMLHSLDIAKKSVGTPSALILNTVAGKGVSFMEGKPEWHDKVPTEEELQIALKELRV